MYLIANIAAGLAATIGVIGVAASGIGPAVPPSPSAATAVISDTAASVNRPAKGDRLVTQKREAPKTPVKTLREEQRRPMEGCDPLVSPLTRSSLSQLSGRCIARLETGPKHS